MSAEIDYAPTWRAITARFASRCAHCNTPIPTGHRAMWSPGNGRDVYHPGFCFGLARALGRLT
jgi:hypothetical protein